MGNRVTAAVTAPGDALDAGIVRAVTYAALFDYPLTLPELRATMDTPVASTAVLRERLRNSAWLATRVRLVGTCVVPRGRADLVSVRLHRQQHSLAILERHRLTLRVLSTVPFVRAIAISGSLAWLNADADGDLDLFVVAEDGHVWTTAVLLILTAKVLRRRREVCANVIVGRSALAFAASDQFTASQILALRPVDGPDLIDAVAAANPCVRAWYPNPEASSAFPRLRGAYAGWRTAIETAMRPLGRLLEGLCRAAYRWHLRRRSSEWTSPEAVRWDRQALKLHTRSHRARIDARYRSALAAAGVAPLSPDPAPDPHRGDVWPGNNSAPAG